MEPFVPPAPQVQSSASPKKGATFFFVILGLVLVALGSFYWFQKFGPLTGADEMPSGLLSLYSPSSDQNGLDTYVLNVATRTLVAEQFSPEKISASIGESASPDGAWSASARPKKGISGDALQSPESWEVYLTNAQGEKLVTDGYEPHWLSDGVLSILKNDGIYAHDLRSGEEMQIATKLGIDVKIGMTYAISPDGSKLAWTDSAHSELVIGSLFEDPYRMGVTKILAVAAGHPVFSPDGKYLAFEKNTTTSSTIMLYDLARDTVETLLEDPLAEEGTQAIFIAEWKPLTTISL